MSAPPPESHLPKTQWTLIARLRRGTPQDAQRALDELISQYRYPLFCYLRRRGYHHYDADDILQDFFMKLLRNESFNAADASKGRLRSMLHVSLDRFIISWESLHKHRRKEFSVEDDPHSDSERRYQHECFQSHETPDQIYQRKWTLTLLGAALNRVGAQYKEKGRERLFEVLRPVLMDGGSLRGIDGPQLAEAAGVTYGALRTSLMRMLVDYQEALHDEILQTVEDPAEAKEELAQLRLSVTKG
ncbi:RNA polymerase sigma-70 factor, ECF subfamily [Prosthecobacter debontii]|uniref:RNA polymerase sigma-70 factor, ECF subfamily n=1 Tax=Prosthecobacter debontii TaxID=48467 RepID=A0A1T4WK67_9BACT|nr:sigma-70 family RNA polymerase sigma factor [Prosthecobacter debontii]SKA77557.1 RNA polymerase sigma-70 factor, ECF subfamily [Prosthecobacter debontii]